jgi:U3 small nucleolar RNA-associated protein 25
MWALYKLIPDIKFLLTWSRNPESIEEQATNQDESDKNFQSEVVSSDEDKVEEPVVRPYAALLQSLVTDSKHPTKRKKLDDAQGTGIGSHTHEKVTFDALNEVDQVEEAEEGPELAVDGLLEGEQSDTEDTSDPFEAHFAGFDNDDVAGRLRAIQKDQWTTQKATTSSLGKVIFTVPEAIRGTEISLPEVISGPEGLKLKHKLSVSIARQKPIFDPLEKSLAPCIFNYYDFFFCERTPLNSESIRRIVCLHAINHVFK